VGNKALFESPGAAIKAALEKKGWSQQELAIVTGKSLRAISDLVSDKSRLTPSTAVALAAAFGDDPTYWLRLDTSHQLSLLNEESGSEVKRRAKIFDVAPIRDMQKRGWVSASKDIDRLEGEVAQFFDIASIDEEPKLTVSARKTSPLSSFTMAERAWCFRARQMAAALPQEGDFDPSRLPKAKSDLRRAAGHPKEAGKVARILASFGIRFVVVEPLPGCRIDGAAFWLSENDPVIAVSVRHNRMDAFWFTLMHEFSHIENNDALSVDSDLVRDPDEAEERQLVLVKDVVEQRADAEAADALIPKPEMDSLVGRLGPLYPKQRIVQFANRMKIHPGIVVGQLQHRGEIGYGSHRQFLVKVRELIIETAFTDGWGYDLAPGMFSTRGTQIVKEA
jgi:HTH-type transcriptional regulator/antitoxin HigA